jgi:Alpha 1,4-glycosyltransferase conserved region
MSNLFAIDCFWFGGLLGEIEQICLLSMLKQGHKVRLFHYEKLLNVPGGIEIADAKDILPRDEFIFHRANGSPALGADKLRYRIMKNGLGLWLDTDVILLRSIDQDDAYIFGLEVDAVINNAVLYLPMNASITEEICNFVDQIYPIPPFYDTATRIELERRAKSGFPVDVQDLPWGVYGPRALTYFVQRNNLHCFAQPSDVFYPVDWREAHALFASAFNNGTLITTSTIAVHLWNYVLRRPSKIRPHNPVGKLIVEKDCFVERFAREQLGFRMADVL